MTYVRTIAEKVRGGGWIAKEEALRLYDEPLDELCQSADDLRAHFCANTFDLCTIINAKSGKCSENCKFCAQSAHNHTGAMEYPLRSPEEITRDAGINHDQGVLRYSIVTSGKRLSDSEVDKMCETVRRIRAEVGISVCVSFGLLNEDQYRRLKAAGVSRVHNNLETSRRFFPFVCTTHSFDEKIAAIKAARRAGLSVCSGGIMGLGETPEDRVDMALTLRGLQIKSVPVNLLNPIPGTPFEALPPLTVDDMRRVVAVYRFILPDASIRLAGGRGLLPGLGAACFCSGANAAISGDMLTTAGITVKKDLAMIARLGYERGLQNE